MLSALRRAVTDFMRDDALELGAALAFYTALSLSPLLLVLLYLASFLGPTGEDSLVSQLTGLVGAEGGRAIRLVIDNTQSRPTLANVAGIVSLVTLLFSAAGVFGQLQTAMNRIWEVEARPGSGLGDWVRKRLVSAGMVVSIGFLIMVSLAVSAVIAGAWSRLAGVLPGLAWMWSAA